MKIQMKINFKIIFFILFSTFIYAEDINRSLNLVLKDSLVDISKIDSKFQNQPEYMFLNALIDTDGESAKSKFIEFQNKYPSHRLADNAVFEIGSYFYSKGYYVKSSQWYKKVPIYYRDSELLEESIDMFFQTLEITNAKDSIKYYKNVFSKLYQIVEEDNQNSEYVSSLDQKEKTYNQQFTIQIGAFKEYSRAESRMYMLRDIGFGVMIQETLINEEPFFVIREGIYSTRKSADKVASRIKARTGIKCIIIEL